MMNFRRARRFVFSGLLGLLAGSAYAADGIGLAEPGDLSGFDQLIAPMFAKKNESAVPPANSGFSPVMPPTSDSPKKAEAQPVAQGTAASGEKANSREEIVRKAIEAAQKDDREGFLAHLIPALRESPDGAETFRRVKETTSEHHAYRWTNEQLVRAVGGAAGQKAILQLYLGEVHAKDREENSQEVFVIKVLCGVKKTSGMDECLIQEIKPL